MIDGFPTTSGGSAIATGALLVAGNARNDHSVISPDRSYVELDPVTRKLAARALTRVEADRDWARAVAGAGRQAVVDTLDVRQAMRLRLTRIGLI